MKPCLRRALLLLAFACISLSGVRAGAQARPARNSREAEYPRLDDALKSLEREPMLLVAEGLEPLVEPDALRARLALLFGRPVVSLSDPEADSALATLYCARAPGARRGGFITLRLSMQGLDLWQRIPAQSLSGDAAGAIANAVIDMLWSERIASLSGPELLDPFCPPGLTCVEASDSSQRFYAGRRPADQALLDPWDAREPRFMLLESRAYWTRGDPWGAPASDKAVKRTPASGGDAGVRERAK